MQRNYKSTPKESAFSPNGLNDEPLSAGVSLFNIMMTKDVPGFPNYFVTADGRVYSKRYRGKYGIQELKFATNHKGYRVVSLACGPQIKKTFPIHRLVAQAFIPNPNNLLEVNHRNGNKKHNYYLNLEWCTRLQNMQHAEKQGLMHHARGTKVATCRLKEEDVLKIREIYSQGQLTQKEVGKLFDVGQNVVSHIIRKSTWKHI